MPLLSVVIPDPKTPGDLADLVWSVLRQPLERVELIIVACAGQRGVLAHSRQLSRADERVRLLVLHGQEDRGAAINAGLDAARGTYIAFADADGLAMDGAYAEMVRQLESTGSDLAVGPGEIFGHRRGRLSRGARGSLDVPGQRVDLISRPGLAADDLLATKVFRAGFLRAHGLQAAEGIAHEAAPMLVRAYAQAAAIDILPRPVFWHRAVDGAAQARQTVAQLDRWITQTSAALEQLDRAPARARSLYAEVILARDLLQGGRLEAIAGLQDALAGLDLVRRLAGIADTEAFAAMTVAQRWQVAVVAVGHPELVHTIRGGDASIHRDASLRLDDALVPEPLLRTLGLDREDLTTAFLARFVSPRRATAVGRTVIPQYESEPDVSVVIPAHNVGPFVDELLHSIRSSVDVRLEVIVVDDSSTDDTWQRLQAHAAIDPRVRVYRSPGRGGGQARNYGVGLARGTYLAFADGDDLVPPAAYSALLDAARRTEADIVSATYLKFFAMSTWDAREGYGGAYSLPVAGLSLASYPQLARHRAVWNRLINREFWLEHALPFPGVPRANDIVAFLSALTAARRLTVIPDVAYVYRDRPGTGSMTSAAGSVDYTISYLSEEAICARLVAQSGSGAVAREFWLMVLTVDAWGNIGKYLAASNAQNPSDGDEVPAYVAALLDLAPDVVFREISAERQAVWALTAAGRLEEAHTLVQASAGWKSVTPEAALTAVASAMTVDRLAPHIVSRLAWKYVLRRLIDDRDSRTAEFVASALPVLRTLITSHDCGIPVIPSAIEGRLAAALTDGEPTDVVHSLSAPSEHPDARFVSDARRRYFVGPRASDATGYLRVVAVRWDRGDATRCPLGVATLVPGSDTWRAEVDPDVVPAHGRWAIEIEYEDRWGLRRAPLPFTERRRSLVPARWSRVAATSAWQRGSALTIRAPLAQRLRRAARRALRHLPGV